MPRISCVGFLSMVRMIWIIFLISNDKHMSKLLLSSRSSVAEATASHCNVGIRKNGIQTKERQSFTKNIDQPTTATARFSLAGRKARNDSSSKEMLAQASKKWNLNAFVHDLRQKSNFLLPFSLTALQLSHHNHAGLSSICQQLKNNCHTLLINKPLLVLPTAAAAISLGISILRPTTVHAYSKHEHSKKMKPQEVIMRTLTFWKRAAPIILHYKFTQTWLYFHSKPHHRIIKSDNDEHDNNDKRPSLPWKFQYYNQQRIDDIYKTLHDKHAPEALEIILQMRGLFIKIGQVLSSRPDFIPEAFVNVMQTVQDDVPPWDANEIFDIIDKSWRTEFNLGVYDLLETFDPKVLGSASIGQVHLGKLRKDVRERMNLGKERELVAIKVMHLDAEDRFRNDFKIFKWLCRIALPGWAPIMREFESQMMTEFDYIHEAENLEIVRKNMMASPYRNQVVVPQPLLEYCTTNVLVMEFLDGVKMESAVLNDLTSALGGDSRLAKKIMEEKRRGMFNVDLL
jgi:hypothetical protein